MMVFSLVILAILILLVLNYIYTHSPNYLNEYNKVKKFNENIPDNLEIMNTGSNHAYYCIDWSIVGVNGFSLASGAQSISWDYRLFEKYRSKIGKNKLLLIVLSNLVLGFMDYPQDEANRRYYHFLKPEEIPNGNWWKKLKYHYLPVLSNWRNIVHCFYHRGKMFKEPEPSLKYAEQESDNRIRGWKSQFKLRDLQHRESLKHLEGEIKATSQLLRHMIEEARKDGIVPILMLPPLSEIINKKISDEFINAVIDEPVANVASDVPFLNYMRDDRFQDYRYYFNGDFMNQAGREKFMPILWQDIKNVMAGNLKK